MTLFRRTQSPINVKLYELLNEKKLVDVTLVADGQFIQGHKLVLAAASIYFEEIFNILPEKQPAIFFKDISCKQVQQMMQFIYCGNVDIKAEEVAEFKKLLESLKIEFDQASDESIEGGLSDNESYVDDKDFEDMIDVDEPVWADVTKIKKEPEDEASAVILEEQEEENDSEHSSDVAQDPSSEHKYALSQPLPIRSSFIVRRVFAPSASHNIFKKNITPISLDRVVPSKRHQHFMNVNPETCPFCEKLCKTSKHRNEHVKYCFINPNRIVSVCPLCAKSVCDPYYLRKHMRNVHGDRR